MQFRATPLQTVFFFLLIFAALAMSGLAGSPLSAEPADEQAAQTKAPQNLSGIWGTKYGEMLVRQTGDSVKGVLIKTSGFCPFENGEQILEGTLLEDSLAGTFKMCQADDDCGPPVKAHAVLLVADGGILLSGSAHSKEALCPLVGFSKSDDSERGLYFKRLAGADAVAKSEQMGKIVARSKRDPGDPTQTPAEPETPVAEAEALEPIPVSTMPGPPAPPGSYDPRRKSAPTSEAKRLLLEGKQMLNTGRFEQARKLFEQVLDKDPGNPVALTGVGVTWYGRNDYEQALAFYKRAIAADPNFGMAYYNAACIYALQKKPNMAMRWLKIAAMNGFVVIEAMQQDPDLSSLRALPDYKRLVAGEF
jgi:hypothetical protein